MFLAALSCSERRLPFLRMVPVARLAAGPLVFGLSSYPPNLEPWGNTGTAAGTAKTDVPRPARSAPTGMRGELAETWERGGDTGLGVPSARRGVPQRRAGHAPRTSSGPSSRSRPRKSTAYMRGQIQGVAGIETPDAGPCISS